MAKEMTGIGIRLKNLIKEQGMTQQQFAAKCNVSKETLISHFSSENMSIDYIKKYAIALDVSADYLLFGEERALSENAQKNHYRSNDVVPMCDIYGAIELLMDTVGNINTDDKENYKICIEKKRVKNFIDRLSSLKKLKAGNNDEQIENDINGLIEKYKNTKDMFFKELEVDNITIRNIIYNPDEEEIGIIKGSYPNYEFYYEITVKGDPIPLECESISEF